LAIEKLQDESENVVIRSGNNMGREVQVDEVAKSNRSACQGGGFENSVPLGGILEIGADKNKWQRADGPQVVLTLGSEEKHVDTLKQAENGVEVEGPLVDPNVEEEGPISVGPNCFGPLADLNPEEISSSHPP
jgi:hypothetical protein